MAKVSVEKFLELFQRTGLVEETQLAETLREITEKCGGKLPTSPEELADRIVEAGLLTRWQADNLLQGKHKGFFLGRYKLLGHLGRGGMSNVYLAEHLMMKRRVAIKVLPQNKVEDSSYLERFKLETQAAAALDHPNIVRAFDTDHKDKTYYLVMEYVDGQDLQAMVQKDGPLDFETAADYIAQVSRGLQHAHDAGLIHRDVKPANCLVDARSTVKLLDMGLAKFTGDDRPSLTIAHDETVLGTADYLSPEQALNSHTVDHRADIYSLGCTFYFLLTGHPPFPEGTLPQRLMMHQTKAPESIYHDRPEAPKALVDICNRMMIKSPDGRFQTAGEVADQLAAWLSTCGKLVGGGTGSSGSGVLKAAAANAQRAAEGRFRSAGTRPGETRGPERPARRRREDLPVDDDTLSIADEETTGPTGGATLDLTTESSSIQLVPLPAAKQVKSGGEPSGSKKPVDTTGADTATVDDEETQEIIASVDEVLDLDETMLTGERNMNWPTTSAIAERKRKDRERISPRVYVGAFVGGCLLLVMFIAALWLLFKNQ